MCGREGREPSGARRDYPAARLGVGWCLGKWREMNKAVTEGILAIVDLLAKGASDHLLSPEQKSALCRSVEILIGEDGDAFVREFLAVVRGVGDVLSPDMVTKLSQYP
jgi:hypothetical protein